MVIIIRGGGDLASGIALRLHRCGFQVLITELAEPLVVRRMVSFAEAVHRGEMTVEGITGQLAGDVSELEDIWNRNRVAVLVDPDLSCLSVLHSRVLVDARMRKKPPEIGIEAADLVVGLGPGFTAGVNCHAAVETNRGHNLGRVLWQGSPEPDTGVPGVVRGYSTERVLRAPSSGVLQTAVEIGDLVQEGQTLAVVNGRPVDSPFEGAVRGLLRPGTRVRTGMKIGDVDPRCEPKFAGIVSDKARALGGSVLEAVLSRPDLRSGLWS